MREFYNVQDIEKRKQYLNYLAKLGLLSKLFTDSSIPYLYYRAHENLFCKVFDAKNLSRGDISYDAKNGDLGIGLKTFLHNNGATLQKIAEFDGDAASLRELEAKSTPEEIVRSVAVLRK